MIPRYGPAVGGGAEQHCREFALRLAGRGHHVEVLTSRAASNTTWDNDFPPGSQLVEGLTVHRLSTPGPRDQERFESLSWRALWAGPPSATERSLADEWVLAQGPLLVDLIPWLRERASTFDAVIFFTYLYFPTWAGLPAAATRAPTVLHATAHDEPPFWLPTFDAMFRCPDTYAWSTEEERQLLGRRGAGGIPGAVIGVGAQDTTAGADPAAFRDRFGLGDRPYLLCLGRITEGKGTLDLAAWFDAYKERFPGPLALVLAGEAETELPDYRDVITTGYLEDETRSGALGGCVALVQPSYWESFSMVLMEAWAAGKPALVQARSDVLRGHARRSGGALCFEGWAEFMAAVELLLHHPGLAGQLAGAGGDYAEKYYSWSSVIDRYEALLRQARGIFEARAGESADPQVPTS